MIIIRNNIFPFKGFMMMNICGLVFLRKDATPPAVHDLRHEAIHTVQQREIMLFAAFVSLVLCAVFSSWWYLLGVVLIPFLIYVAGFLAELVLPPYHGATNMRQLLNDAYYDNCFEREAYANEKKPDYWITRPMFAEVKYIMKNRRETNNAKT